MAQLHLHLKLEQDASILADFYSGIEAMDTFIHTRLNAFLKAYNCRFYVLRDEQGIVISMFVTSAGHLYLDEDCKVVRIVSNYIHNDEQFSFDVFKTKRIVRKINTM